jgi:hypothetical protein
MTGRPPPPPDSAKPGQDTGSRPRPQRPDENRTTRPGAHRRCTADRPTYRPFRPRGPTIPSPRPLPPAIATHRTRRSDSARPIRLPDHPADRVGDLKLLEPRTIHSLVTSRGQVAAFFFAARCPGGGWDLCGPPTDERKGKRPAHPAQTPVTFSWQDLTRPLAPTRDVTVLRGAGRECGRRVEAGRLRPAPRQARHPTRRRLARSAGEGHQSPGRGPGKW